MKRLLAVSLLVLTGCAVFPDTVPVDRPVSGTAPALRGHAAQILAEADRLAGEVRAGKMSRSEAAGLLGVFRVRVAGRNAVDDAVFAVYHQIALDRDAGRIDSETARTRMEAALRDWMRRWKTLARKPADPAFTNFLLKVYQLPQLGS